METFRGLKFFVVVSFLLTQFSVYGKLISFGARFFFPFVCVGFISLHRKCKTHGLQLFFEHKYQYFYCKAPFLNILKVKNKNLKKKKNIYIYIYPAVERIDHDVFVFFTDAIAYEKLQMKFSEPPSFKPANTAICTWLKNLESLGFQKEVVRKSVKRPGKDRPDAEARIVHA